MIKVVDGNLLSADVDIIAHQVNCKGVMGSGVALQIKKMYYEAFKPYKALCDAHAEHSFELLGNCQVIECHNGRYVANLFGQDRYGIDKCHTVYMALQSSLTSLKNMAKQYEYSVALPYGIGCARGGGDWDKVYKIIDEVFKDYEVTLWRLQ